MIEVLKNLNSVSPLGLAVLLGYVIFLLVRNKRAVSAVSSNHLSGLPDMQSDVKKLVQLGEQNYTLLLAVNNNLVYLKARLNGKSTEASE